MNTTLDTNFIEERLRFCLPRLAAEWQQLDLRIAELGLDSMDTVELLCVIHEEFGVRLTEEDFHAEQTIGGLIEAIARKRSH